MLGSQLRPGLRRALYQITRHWPFLITLAAVTAVLVAALSFISSPAARPVNRSLTAVADKAAGPPAVAVSNSEQQVIRKLAAHRPAARARPDHHLVRRGETLSAIARREYGHARLWPALWWVNRHRVHNPDAVAPGTVLVLSGWHPDKQWIMTAALKAVPRPPVAATAGRGGSAPSRSVPARSAPVHAGIYSFSQLEALWVAAGGPPGVQASAASIAECESGGNPGATNPSSGAAGLWQILGNPFPGNPYDPATNAAMAVAKYNGVGGSFAPWVCQAGGRYGPAIGMAPVAYRFIPLRLLAFAQALRYRYHWYVYGGTGPAVFDCSGLVYRSYLNTGHLLPRTTFGMLAGGYHLHYTAHPRKGMLAFFGSGHVELYVRPGVTYGAHHTGTQVGYRHYYGSYHPTAFMWVSRR